MILAFYNYLYYMKIKKPVFTSAIDNKNRFLIYGQ